MTYYGRWTYKFEEAARRGAIAALIVHDTAGAGYGWNVVQSAGGREFQHRPAARARSSRCCCRAGSRGRSPPTCSSAPGMISTALKRQARTAAFRPIDLKATLLGRRRGRPHPADQPQRHRQADRVEISGRDGQLRRPLGRLRHRRRPTRRAGRSGRAPPTMRSGLAAMIEIARAVRGRPAARADPGVRRLDGRGARPARLRILCAAPALSA